ncbi:MAG: penicillin acylase family protein [Acidobacteria bacterium]|nr:penicillin acylase family protein [Acidobacteriota bacterium]
MSLRRTALLVVSSLLSSPLLAAGHEPPKYTPQKGTEILWDTWGVPHIYAKSVADMFYAYGWAQTAAHGNLLLTVYGNSRGRAAEYWGPKGNPISPAANNLNNDTWVWTNGIPQRGEEWLAAQTPEFRKYLDAFAAGINAYAAAHGDMLSVEAKRVLPVTTLDIITHEEKFVNFTFVAGQRLMFPTRNAGTSDAALDPRMAPFADDDPAAPNMDMEDGSNGWAIGPSHSASGKAMLLMNPHLAWAGEQSYFQVQLTAPGIDLSGATQIGLPVLRFSFSPYNAITNTVNTNDGADLYKIVLKDDGYLFDSKVLPFKVETHMLKVLQPDGSTKEQELTIKSTVHGPIVRTDNGSPIALRVAGLDKPQMLDQYWHMDTAHTFAEYEAQLKRLQLPMYNVMYADRDGHIMYFFASTLPKRSEGDYAFWGGVVPGDESKYLWNEYLPYEKLPKLIDPPSGYVQNSNQPPWDAGWPTMLDPAEYPAYVAPKFPHFRSDRGLRMLSEDKKINFEALTAKKLSTHMELADRMLPELLEAVNQFGSDGTKKAADLLKSWDRNAEANSRGALLFYVWAQKFTNAQLTISTASGSRNFAVPYKLEEPLTTPRGLKDPKYAVQLLDEAIDETVKTYGAIDRPWGEVMRFQINGQSDGNTTAERGAPIDGVDFPGNGGYGNLGIFRVVTFGPIANGIKTPVHGDTITMAVEFTKVPHAKVLVSYGNCSQPGCKHHTDQLPLMRDKQWRDLWLSRKEVEGNLEKRDALQ